MAKNKFNTAYSEKQRVQFVSDEESRTLQAPAEEADIRNIIRNVDPTGLIKNVNKGVAQYGDF